jgi:LmbE family N-acetylglucosaminyl deacetylase
MIAATFGASRQLRRILCLGAHSDDIEIGCAGTLLQLLTTIPRAHVRWVVFSGDDRRSAEARGSATRLLGDVADIVVDAQAFRDGYFPYSPEIKDYFETLKAQPTWDLILTHNRDDRHQDHRLISDLTWNTFRNHLVLEYEIPKYDGDLGQPNVFVPLSHDVTRQKISHLMNEFASQRDKRWFSEETFLGLMRLRGVESAAPDGMAEAFYARKLLWDPRS